MPEPPGADEPGPGADGAYVGREASDGPGAPTGHGSGDLSHGEPQLDYVKTNHRDVLEEPYHRQMEEVVARLLRYRPTQVAVEVEPGQVQVWQERYAQYRDGRLELGRNEIYQLGFRVAGGMGHSRIYGIDCRMDLEVEGVLSAARNLGMTGSWCWSGPATAPC